MTKYSEGYSQDKLYDSIKSIEYFGEFFDVQAYIAEHVQAEGLSILPDIVEVIIQVITTTPQEIPLVKKLLEKLCNQVHNEHKVYDRIEQQLMRFVSDKEQPTMRMIALDILAQYRPQKIAYRLIDTVLDPSETSNIRVKVLECLTKTMPDSADLLRLVDILESDQEELVLLTMAVFEQHAELSQTQTILQAFEKLVTTTPHPHVQCRAIELLGVFGDVDILERMCMLPYHDQLIRDAITKMLQHILMKPRNILAFRPENFEHLIKEWLRQLGYQDVQVTRAVKDEGVDVVAYKEGHGINKAKYKVIVQCKRYSTNPVGVKAVQRLEDAIHYHQAKEGLLITTSTFAREAREFVRDYQYITLVEGKELQEQLNEVFGEQSYCIVNRME